MTTKKIKSEPQEKNRSQIIIQSGYLFIGTNFLLGFFNILVGIVSGSIAITSDAVHSFIDSASGLLVIISEKLASHHKLTPHRAKIERVTTIIIAFIIIIAGVHIIIDSIEKIITPTSPEYNVAIVIVLVASIIMKYLLATFLKKTGNKLNSTVLTASGAETLNDTWISIAVLFSALFYLASGIDIEAYISLLISALIIKTGLEFIFPHISKHHHHHLEKETDHTFKLKP